MKWSPEARLASSQAAFAMLNGGTLCLYVGERQAAELRFSDPALRGDHLSPLAPDESAEGGKGVDSFVAKNAAGDMVAEGTCGAIGSGADCELKFPDIPRGARVEIDSLTFAPGD